jgi:hypothetical protein
MFFISFSYFPFLPARNETHNICSSSKTRHIPGPAISNIIILLRHINNHQQQQLYLYLSCYYLQVLIFLVLDHRHGIYIGARGNGTDELERKKEKNGLTLFSVIGTGERGRRWLS